jgi:transcriptional regulator with XRE-family HTH domain
MQDKTTPRPACVACVLEARKRVPAGLTQLDAGQNIWRRMRELDISMRDLARRGLLVAQISKWVNGERNPSPEMRPALAAALEMSQLDLEAMLPRPGRRSKQEGAEWRCALHRPDFEAFASTAELVELLA